MKITILTLFPEMFTPLEGSIIGRARQENKIAIKVVNIRDFATPPHFKCDDYPFGGGAGMVMMVEPVYKAMEDVDPYHKAHRIYMSPKGHTFSQSDVPALLSYEHIVILCGHYEGVDQRIIDGLMDEEVSIGDYVLTGGELPAMVICDAVSRYVDGVISDGSLSCESFSEGLLEYPHYTRPASFKGMDVPSVLLSGNHGEVDKWRRQKSLEITKKLRPDLLGGDK